MTSEKKEGTPEQRDRMLQALEELLEITPTDVESAMGQVAQCVIELTRADKVDVFLFEPSTTTLVAVGTSDSPLGRKQKALGLDRIPVTNGGRTVEVFQTGKTWHHPRQDEDPDELVGIKQGLGVRSHIGVLIEVGGKPRGVLDVQSCTPDFFNTDDVRFLESAARWVGIVAHRVELGEALTKAALEQGRRTAAEELITVLAHDLGNHLTPMRIRLELIHRRAAREKAVPYLRDVEAAEQSLKALSQLISDLLDVGRLEQGLFTLQQYPVDLVALAEEVAQVASTPGKEVQLTGMQELVAQADPARLRQALANLVANAQKYSPVDLPVNIDVNRQQREDGAWALISVKDQGPGIAPEVMPRLFERFSKGPGSKGLGLGLYLVRSIAEAHGGTLTVRSELGKGALFVLALPLIEE
ncbi:two-component hybrid sensor and regulator [Cystobacter fuscus DSM 2262]|uniref:histidine kinase n=1 Tax=Cystobacter fuscus (strain ATCC 25194 / DSM 2262 / NBRC 100088 / M29) TaxID=1242864 RepID=S9PGV3_CYSF2|nr:ATP-binding protein [Cystobacter fuscus]EPX63570.1 two-component hybrid sensor and regulator [Cystobacter fuscus DSM 2262]